MHVKSALLSCALILGAGSAAQATTTVYTDQAAYLAAISGAATDSFDDLGLVYYGGAIARSVGGYGYQASADGGLYGAGEGDGDGWLSTNNEADAITFSNFTGGVSAIGGNFFGSNISGGYADLILIALTFTDAHGVQTVQQPMHPDQGTFLGFVSSDGIQSLSVQVTGFPSDGMTPEEAASYFQWPTANNLILGQSPQDPPPPETGDVPEPASWAMMLAGFGLVGAAMRARRSAVSFG